MAVQMLKKSFFSIQTMSCKLLLNLVDCIRQKSEGDSTATTSGTIAANVSNPNQGNVQGRQLLLRILEVFVLKFKTISKLQLPILLAKWFVIFWY